MASDLGIGWAIYSVDLNEFMSGVTSKVGILATLNDNINTILLRGISALISYVSYS